MATTLRRECARLTVSAVVVVAAPNPRAGVQPERRARRAASINRSASRTRLPDHAFAASELACRRARAWRLRATVTDRQNAP
ncbi:hypothetical protein [Xanthomonas arboricola]|uniref:hypothetical protein n=1 Tax=Xanthomonas arboricola TaxID=56448 RepID=UPI0012906036|nr:hypothetical protein [Xanthomonas arboricola]